MVLFFTFDRTLEQNWGPILLEHFVRISGFSHDFCSIASTSKNFQTGKIQKSRFSDFLGVFELFFEGKKRVCFKVANKVRKVENRSKTSCDAVSYILGLPLDVSRSSRMSIFCSTQRHPKQKSFFAVDFMTLFFYMSTTKPYFFIHNVQPQ